MKLTNLVVLAMMAGGALMAEGPAARQVHQQRRIAQGVRSGELTRTETARLQAQERALHHEIIRDRIDGGGLTAGERAKIDAKQDAMSRRIDRQKHDRQAR